MCSGDDHNCPQFELHRKKLLDDLDSERRSFLKSAFVAGGGAAAMGGERHAGLSGVGANTPGQPTYHYLPANADTVHWGYFSKLLKPQLEVDSGDYVTIEALTHHANDDAERMIKGDPGAESVFLWTKDKKGVNRRGAGPIDGKLLGRGAGEGFGVHICTGPVFIRGAEPGDILEVRIMDVKPRPCANPAYAGKSFGSNAAAWWGFQYNDLITDPKPREVCTIYEIDTSGQRNWAQAVYNFRWTPQTDPYGVVHKIIDYPGVPVDHSTVQENHNVLKNVRIPIRPHFGVMGLAPKEADIVDSIPPSYFGGNMDNWRDRQGRDHVLSGRGAGWLVLDRRFACRAGRFRIVRHRHRNVADRNLPAHPAQAEYADGLARRTELSAARDTGRVGHARLQLRQLSCGAWARRAAEIYKKSSIDLALRDAFRKMRSFLMTTKGLSEDEAISLISIGVDFGVTQVVDGNWGIHAIIKKSLFAGSATV